MLEFAYHLIMRKPQFSIFNSPFSICRPRKAFTLVELLLVIGIIAILSSIVIAALSPTRQLGTTRDAKRRSDVNTIINAMYQYSIDNSGNLPPGIAIGTDREICKTGAASCANGVDLDVLTGSYLVSIPLDPHAPESGTGSRYFIRQDSNGRLTVSAPLAEETDEISVTR